MEGQQSIIPYLFMATFVIVIVYGLIQYSKAKKAKQRNEHSVAERQGIDTARNTGHAGDTTRTGNTEIAGRADGANTPPKVPR